MGSQSDSKGFITRRRESRGQTTLDFAIGMSIFLAVVVFIFLFIPGILSPFQQGGQADTASSNRVADQLAKGALGSPADPFVLDRYCTVEFFDRKITGLGSPPSQCSYSGTSLNEELGLDSFQSVNITIEKNVTGTSEPEILCWDPVNGTAGQKESECGSSSTGLKRGHPQSASTDDSVTSRRVVSLGREDVTLYVRMW